MISIIIIVKNDRGILETIRNLKLLKKPHNFEVIVVDSSMGKLDDIKNKFTKIKWVTFKPKSTRPNSIPEQRNVGVKLAKGKIIVFIDANCIPDKFWLDEITSPIIKDNENIVSGKTISYKKTTSHDQVYKDNSDKKYIDECSTINLAIKRTVFNNIGYFDETFDYGSDVDFIWRCIDAGYKVRYIKNAIISHDWGGIKTEIERSFKYGKAKANLYRHHINRLPRLIKKDYYVLLYAIFILFSPLTIFWHFYPFLLIITFAKNIKNEPHVIIRNNLIYTSGFLYQIFNF